MFSNNSFFAPLTLLVSSGSTLLVIGSNDKGFTNKGDWGIMLIVYIPFGLSLTPSCHKTHAIAKYIPFKFITTGRTKFNRYNSYLEGNKHLHSDAG